MVVRCYRPDATRVRVNGVEARRIHDAGVFEAEFPEKKEAFDYQLECTYGDRTFTHHDAYAFLPTVGDIDVYLAAEGRHYKLWERFGAHPRTLNPVAGTSFAVWAPAARPRSVVGDCNGCYGRLHAMRTPPGRARW